MKYFSRKFVPLVMFAVILGSFGFCFFHPEEASAEAEPSCCLAHNADKTEGPFSDGKITNLAPIDFSGTVLKNGIENYGFASCQVFPDASSPGQIILLSVIKKE